MAAESGGRLDYLVVGATPLAVMLAWLLASRHGKRVAVLGAPEHPLRVSRGFDLSVAPLTRPERWDILHKSRTETLKIIAQMDKSVLQATDIAFAGHGREAEMALGHIRHMAAGFGELTEPLTSEASIRYGNGFILRGAERLRRRVFFARARNWLADVNVEWFTLGKDNLHVSATGASLHTEDEKIRANVALFCDGRMAADFLPKEMRPTEVEAVNYCGLLTEPGAQLSWPSLVDVANAGLAFMHEDGKSEAWVAGDKDRALSWLEGVMAHESHTRLAGMAEQSVLTTPDGAPLIARLPRIRSQLIVGLGASGLFLAPALARYVVGTAENEEAAFFDRHLSGGDRDAVVEYHGMLGGAP